MYIHVTGMWSGTDGLSKMLMACTIVFTALFSESCQGTDVSDLRTTILEHFSESRHHADNLQYKMAAMRFIFEEFKAMGLEAVYQDFYGNQNGTNVIGIMKGSRYGSRDDRVIGLGSHYDTVPGSPGVDDNGSGMAALLAVARQLTDDNRSGRRRNNTVIFVAFDMEEEGYEGSRYFISDWYKPKFFNSTSGVLDPYGFIVMDTMMEFNTTAESQIIPSKSEFRKFFPNVTSSIEEDNMEGDFLINAYRDQTGEERLALAFETAWKDTKNQAYDIETFGLPNLPVEVVVRTPLGDFLRSDHSNFWKADMAAIFLTDSADLRGDMKACYHRSCDDVPRMLTEDNLEFLDYTVDTLVRTIDKLSEPSQDTSGSPTITAFVPLIVGVLLLHVRL